MFGSKKPAPSLWSLDSGYESGNQPSKRNSNQEREQSASHGANEDNNADNDGASSKTIKLNQDGSPKLDKFWNVHVKDQVRLRKDSPTIDPILTRISVFTSRDCSRTNSGFVVPSQTLNEAPCVTCELWSITNPGEDYKCETCRIPKVITSEPEQIVQEAKESKPASVRSFKRLSSIFKGKAKDPKIPQVDSRCTACELCVIIDPKDPTECPGCSLPKDQVPPSPTYSEIFSQGTVKRSRAGRNAKLPQPALNILQAWLDAHQDNPYPTADEKRQLAQECNITEKQVTTWFTNARARQLNRRESNPSSGSEDEGAYESDVQSTAPIFDHRGMLSDGNTHRRAPSASGSSIYASGSSMYASGSSIYTSNSYSAAPRPAPAPSRRGKKKNYRRNINTQVPPTSATNSSNPTLASPEDASPTQETWQCTFCLRHLVPKSWRRHEETQHRPRSQWTCMLYGPRLSYSSISHGAGSGSRCAFCMQKDPSEDHFLREHRISECAQRRVEDRTFFRPDHLRQHIKNFHGAQLYDVVQSRWKRAAESNHDGWTCGFCAERLTSWDQRETHISNHFKDGLTMAQWQHFPEHESEQHEQEPKIESAACSPAPGLRGATFAASPHLSAPSHFPPVSQHHAPQAHTPICTTSYGLVPPHNTTVAFSSPLPTSLPDPSLLPAISIDSFIDTNYMPAGTYSDMDWAQIGQMVDTQIPTFQQNGMQMTDFAGEMDAALNMEYGNMLNGNGNWGSQ